MRTPSTRTTSPAVSTKGLGLARKFASGGVSASVGTKYQVSDGYLLQRKVSAALSEVTIIDMPSRLLALDSLAILGTPVTYAVGDRAPWRPVVEGRFGQLPDAEAPVSSTFFPMARVAVGTVPAEVEGLPASGLGIATMSPDLGAPVQPVRVSAHTTFGSPNAKSAGWWQATPEFESTVAVTSGDLAGVGGASVVGVLHWLSVKSGYMARGSWLDVRIDDGFIATLAPGYVMYPPVRTAPNMAVRNYPSASACRRTVTVEGATKDVLAVSFGVCRVETVGGNAYAFDSGMSALVVCLFEVLPDGVTLLDSDVLHPNALGPRYSIEPWLLYAGSSPIYAANRVVRHGTVIGAALNVEVHGCWEVLKPHAFEPDGSPASGALLTNYFRYALSGRGFSHVRTSVLCDPSWAATKEVDLVSLYDSDPSANEALCVGWQAPFVWEYEDEDGEASIHGVLPTTRFVRAGPAPGWDSPNSYEGVRSDASINFTRSQVAALAAVSTGVVLTHTGAAVVSPQNTSTEPPERGLLEGPGEPPPGGARYTDGIYPHSAYWLRYMFPWSWEGGPNICRAVFKLSSGATEAQPYSLDSTTGVWTSILLPVVSPVSIYAVVPTVTCYQQAVRDVEDNVVIPAGYLLSSVPQVGQAYDARTYVWSSEEWVRTIGVYGSGGVHFLGNGMFGQPLNLFGRG